MKAGAIYYSDGRPDPKILQACQSQLRKAFDGEIINCSLTKTGFGDKEIVLDMERGYKAYFTQIVTALDATDADVVFFTEHDNLYHPSHFDFIPPEKDKFYYDLSWWKVRADGLAVHWAAAQVSGLVCYRDLALKYYRSRLASFDPENFDRKFEPTVGIDYEVWWAEYPSIDVRHDKNLTYNKWKLEHFRDKRTAINFQSKTVADIPGWDTTAILEIVK